MYKIAMCISEKNLLSETKNVIEDAFKRLRIKHIIYCFENADLLFKAFLRDNLSVDIFIIDTEFSDLNGVKIVKDLRKKNLTSQVIFVSNSKIKAYDAIKIDVFRYILKKDIKSSLTKCVLLDYKKNFQSKYVAIKLGSTIKKIKTSKIMYLETCNRGSNVHCIGGVVYIPIKLSELLEIFPKDIFCRCHFSFAVNIEKVVAVKRYEATLETGDFVPISKNRYQEFREMFLDYLSL